MKYIKLLIAILAMSSIAISCGVPEQEYNLKLGSDNAVIGFDPAARTTYIETDERVEIPFLIESGAIPDGEFVEVTVEITEVRAVDMNGVLGEEVDSDYVVNATTMTTRVTANNADKTSDFDTNQNFEMTINFNKPREADNKVFVEITKVNGGEVGTNSTFSITIDDIPMIETGMYTFHTVKATSGPNASAVPPATFSTVIRKGSGTYSRDYLWTGWFGDPLVPMNLIGVFDADAMTLTFDGRSSTGMNYNGVILDVEVNNPNLAHGTIFDTTIPNPTIVVNIYEDENGDFYLGKATGVFQLIDFVYLTPPEVAAEDEGWYLGNPTMYTNGGTFVHSNLEQSEPAEE